MVARDLGVARRAVAAAPPPSPPAARTGGNSSAGGSAARPRSRTSARGLGLAAVMVAASLLVPLPRVVVTSTLVGPGGRCLSPDATPAVDNTPVVLAPCTGGPDDNWTQPGDGTVTYQGRCLDVRGADDAPGTPLQLFSCNGTGAQQWELSAAGLVNNRSGLCVAADPAEAQDGEGAVRARMQPCSSGATAQAWKVGAVGRATLPGRGGSGSAGAAAGATANPLTSTDWTRDFHDDFDGPLSDSWGRYGWGGQPVGHGGMGLYDVNNVYTDQGHLVLRTRYSDGVWTSAGVSAARLFNAYQGRWEVRARFDRAVGLGYAFLIYPADGGWPPEIDLAEGHPNGPVVLATLHWAPGNQQIQKRTTVTDMTSWHTYGVIVEKDFITYTLDGKVWSRFHTANTPKRNMWLGLQTAAISCPSTFECVPGNVPGQTTPASSTIDIDWVAHYSAG